MSHQEARSESQHQGQPPTDQVSGEVDELQEANGRLLIASLQAEEQVETHVALNTALRQLMETRQQAADEREHLLARERDARTQLEAFAAENARQRRTFEALLDASADHNFMLDPAGRFAYVNRAAALVVGAVSPATEGDSERILGRTARELGFTEGFLQQFEGNHARAMCGETSVAETSFSSPLGVARGSQKMLNPNRPGHCATDLPGGWHDGAKGEPLLLVSNCSAPDQPNTTTRLASAPSARQLRLKQVQGGPADGHLRIALFVEERQRRLPCRASHT